MPQENKDRNGAFSVLKWPWRSPKVKSVMALYQKINVTRSTICVKSFMLLWKSAWFLGSAAILQGKVTAKANWLHPHAKVQVLNCCLSGKRLIQWGNKCQKMPTHSMAIGQGVLLQSIGRAAPYLGFINLCFYTHTHTRSKKKSLLAAAKWSHLPSD